jgi:hypothetical protein
MNKLAPIILCFWSISAQAQDLNYSLYEIKEGTTCSDAKDSLTSRLAAEAYFHRGQYADAYRIYVCMETAKINFNKLFTDLSETLTKHKSSNSDEISKLKDKHK